MDIATGSGGGNGGPPGTAVGGGGNGGLPGAAPGGGNGGAASSGPAPCCGPAMVWLKICISGATARCSSGESMLMKVANFCSIVGMVISDLNQPLFRPSILLAHGMPVFSTM